MKTHSGAKKRFKATAGGKIKRSCQNKNHILNKKTRERKRVLRQGDYVSETQERTIATLIQVKRKRKTTRKGTQGGTEE
jgi:large subunit ribosomal protein L35